MIVNLLGGGDAVHQLYDSSYSSKSPKIAYTIFDEKLTRELTLRAVVAGPHGIAETRLLLKIEVSVSAASWQALERLLVHLAAVGALPALLADAGAFRAESMPRTGRMWTVDLLAELAFVASDAAALAVGAVSVSIAVGNFALVVSQ